MAGVVANEGIAKRLVKYERNKEQHSRRQRRQARSAAAETPALDST